VKEAALLSDASKDERKTRLRSIRVSESLAHSLQKEAADEGTTVNAEINSILSQHFDWHKKAQEFGIAAIPKPLLKSMLEGLDDETLARIGREVIPALWKEIAEFWSLDSSLNGILEFQSVRSKSNPNDRIRVTQEENRYAIVLSHDLGPKWSIIMKNALQEYVNRSFHVEPRMSQGESVVTARFKVNSRDPPT